MLSTSNLDKFPTWTRYIAKDYDGRMWAYSSEPRSFGDVFRVDDPEAEAVIQTVEVPTNPYKLNESERRTLLERAIAEAKAELDRMSKVGDVCFFWDEEGSGVRIARLIGYHESKMPIANSGWTYTHCQKCPEEVVKALPWKL